MRDGHLGLVIVITIKRGGGLFNQRGANANLVEDRIVRCNGLGGTKVAGFINLRPAQQRYGEKSLHDNLPHVFFMVRNIFADTGHGPPIT